MTPTLILPTVRYPRIGRQLGRRRIIFTGTPEGVISGYPRGKQVWLKAGDRLTSTIEKLGELQFSLA